MKVTLLCLLMKVALPLMSLVIMATQKKGSGVWAWKTGRPRACECYRSLADWGLADRVIISTPCWSREQLHEIYGYPLRWHHGQKLFLIEDVGYDPIDHHRAEYEAYLKNAYRTLFHASVNWEQPLDSPFFMLFGQRPRKYGHYFRAVSKKWYDSTRCPKNPNNLCFCGRRAAVLKKQRARLRSWFFPATVVHQDDVCELVNPHSG